MSFLHPKSMVFLKSQISVTFSLKHSYAAMVWMVYIIIPSTTAWVPAEFPCSWILCDVVANVTIIIIDTQNSFISIHLYSCSAATVHKLNRPHSLQLLATVAMCNIVELHLSFALQMRMTNPSRSTLKALGEASGAARRPPWPSPGCFLITL